MAELGPASRPDRIRPLPIHEVIESARIVALDSYDVLDTPEEAGFDALVRQAAERCGAPIAIVSLIDRTRQWFKARVGIDQRDRPRHAGICHATLIGTPGCLLVPDAASDPRFSQLPWVRDAPHIRAYAGAVLLDRDGYRLGTIAAMHPEPGRLAMDALPALQALAREAITLLEAHRAALDAPHPASRAAQLMLVQGWLGVRTEPSGAAVAPGLHLTSIAQDSPAFRAGLQVGDVLLTVGGHGISRSRDIVAALADRPEGSQTVIEFSRSGRNEVSTIAVEPAPPDRMSRRRSTDMRR